MTKSNTPTPKPAAPTMTLGEVMDSVNGQEEIDRWEAFLGSTPATVNWFKRNSIFVLKRREGLSVADAKKFVLELPVGELDDYFAPDAEDEDDPDEPQPLGKPETEAGKGAEQPEQ
ncbi:hypothetical protein P5P86_11755 [Nocardioides sp. BP30]|uniref:hypothetical protein n=1 Tax=Nocardioides sp. BP30 TaxID=3036374 RepID=UPI00246858A1|nr:hypothetical protein [Nocardioides sp. BP30]WGL50639.1 hypothetical protein P5P86_11755 [Nocardioides sp. BP30]